MKLRETFLRRSRIFQGRAVGFVVDTVRLPNQKKAVREYLTHPGAVAVIPLLSKTKILMVKQYRHPVGEVTYEIPAGKRDKGESSDRCVKRELEEETGFTSGSLKKLLSFWPTPAFANEIIHIYVAKKLRKGRWNPDEDEFLRCEVWSLQKAFRAIKNGRIKDSKTIIALLAYKQFIA